MDAGGVLAREAQAQRPTPAALLLGDLDGRGVASDSPQPSPASPPLQRAHEEGSCPSLQTTPMESRPAQLAHHLGSFPSPVAPMATPSSPSFLAMRGRLRKEYRRGNRIRRDKEEQQWQQRGKRRCRV